MFYNVRGHEVQFPHQPYGVQFSFMEKMLRTLAEQGNALLEAPTGCGKTLSLLCSALAWQTKRKKEISDMEAMKLNRTAAESPKVQLQPRRKPTAMRQNPGEQSTGRGETDKGDDFVKLPATHEGDCGKPTLMSRSSRDADGNEQRSPETYSPEDIQGDEDDDVKIPPIPKIYFATRTHSQISQVVRELKRSGYKPTMAILAAKQHYCINKAVLRSGHVDEECERLAGEQFGCRFRSRAGTKTDRVQVQVHDIEELTAACSRAKTCPYFMSRDLALSAELVFCPYSYLLDPLIRKALDLHVSGSVLIFDEAHNIEDVCREGGSMDLDLDVLREVEAAFQLAATTTGRGELYEPLAGAAGRLAQLLSRFESSSAGMLPCGYEEHEAVWQGERALALLEEAGLGPTGLSELHHAYEQARAYEEKATFATEGDTANEAIPASMTRPGAGGLAMGTLSRLVTVLGLLYAPAPQPTPAPQPRHQPHVISHSAQVSSSGGTHLSMSAAVIASNGSGFIPSQSAASCGGAGGESSVAGRGVVVGGIVPYMPREVKRDNSGDYRVVVRRWIAHRSKDRHKARSRARRSRTEPLMEDAVLSPGVAVSLGLWCFNPAVSFRDLARKAHSVVLTSGTLAPLDSFASELGTDFHVRLEAPHVVDMSRQVWAGVITRGPGSQRLSATFKEVANFSFQDDAGEAVLRCCQVIPDGVLLFMPSYGVMDKLMTRWKSTGLWSRLERTKTVVVEGREAGKSFEDAMARYYAAIKAGKGGLFLAVCRGKASEGIDFADQHARGVIILGIPYPAVKDTKVKLKKEYNNAGSGPGSGRPLSQRLLTGDEWYSQQAFRALNQAVGRCIRHKYDWGAIILLDERFRPPARQQQLSRWVRTAVKVYEDFDSSVEQLASFCKALSADPPRPPPHPLTSQPSDDAADSGKPANVPAVPCASAAANPLQAWVAQHPHGAGMKGHEDGGAGDIPYAAQRAAWQGCKDGRLQCEEVVLPQDLAQGVAKVGGGGAGRKCGDYADGGRGGGRFASGDGGPADRCDGGSSGGSGGHFNRFRMSPMQPAAAANSGAVVSNWARGGAPTRTITAFFPAAPLAAQNAPAASPAEDGCYTVPDDGVCNSMGSNYMAGAQNPDRFAGATYTAKPSRCGGGRPCAGAFAQQSRGGQLPLTQLATQPYPPRSLGAAASAQGPGVHGQQHWTTNSAAPQLALTSPPLPQQQQEQQRPQCLTPQHLPIPNPHLCLQQPPSYFDYHQHLQPCDVHPHQYPRAPAHLPQRQDTQHPPVQPLAWQQQPQQGRYFRQHCYQPQSRQTAPLHAQALPNNGQQGLDAWDTFDASATGSICRQETDACGAGVLDASAALRTGLASGSCCLTGVRVPRVQTAASGTTPSCTPLPNAAHQTDEPSPQQAQSRAWFHMHQHCRPERCDGGSLDLLDSPCAVAAQLGVEERSIEHCELGNQRHQLGFRGPFQQQQLHDPAAQPLQQQQPTGNGPERLGPGSYVEQPQTQDIICHPHHDQQPRKSQNSCHRVRPLYHEGQQQQEDRDQQHPHQYHQSGGEAQQLEEGLCHQPYFSQSKAWQIAGKLPADGGVGAGQRTTAPSSISPWPQSFQEPQKLGEHTVILRAVPGALAAKAGQQQVTSGLAERVERNPGANGHDSWGRQQTAANPWRSDGHPTKPLQQQHEQQHQGQRGKACPHLPYAHPPPLVQQPEQRPGVQGMQQYPRQDSCALTQEGHCPEHHEQQHGMLQQQGRAVRTFCGLAGAVGRSPTSERDPGQSRCSPQNGSKGDTDGSVRSLSDVECDRNIPFKQLQGGEAELMQAHQQQRTLQLRCASNGNAQVKRLTSSRAREAAVKRQRWGTASDVGAASVKQRSKIRAALFQYDEEDVGDFADE